LETASENLCLSALRRLSSKGCSLRRAGLRARFRSSVARRTSIESYGRCRGRPSRQSPSGSMVLAPLGAEAPSDFNPRFGPNSVDESQRGVHAGLRRRSGKHNYNVVEQSYIGDLPFGIQTFFLTRASQFAGHSPATGRKHRGPQSARISSQISRDNSKRFIARRFRCSHDNGVVTSDKGNPGDLGNAGRSTAGRACDSCRPTNADNPKRAIVTASAGAMKCSGTMIFVADRRRAKSG